MTREEEIKKRLFEISTSNFNNSVVDSSAYFAGFTDGAHWADEHPKPVRVTFKEFEDAAKEVMDKDWQEQQDRLWNMIERNLRAQFIRKACKWLKEQSCCGYIEDTDVNEFIKQFKQAMKGE